ncbi:hypothetical protein DY245_35445 [Streptomyces inhibens]|uniref:Uncharacterized protein n=1 Tax=Streptomyces inhibens TaxID=2293571 RepID=A0A371PU04_STRIH|nr:hypothetical protein [Streptomyces inhibens]REK85919.1 hypothetical protein DY245_35445 [Streptomyces inhibens]
MSDGGAVGGRVVSVGRLPVWSVGRGVGMPVRVCRGGRTGSVPGGCEPEGPAVLLGLADGLVGVGSGPVRVGAGEGPTGLGGVAGEGRAGGPSGVVAR